MTGKGVFARCREKWRVQMEEKWREVRGVRIAGKRSYEEWKVQEAREKYGKVLEEAGRISQKAVSSGFGCERQKTFAEFEEFIGTIGGCVSGAVGSDVVAFVHGWWIPAHRKNFRTQAEGGGEKVASASAVKAVIGHLAKSYSMLGRSDEENPAKSESVRSYREGYRADLYERGVREKRAKVMPEGKMTQLVEFLNGEAQRAEGFERCYLAMDRAIVLYLWETWARGKECGTVKRRQVDVEHGVVRPGWSKTVHQEPSAEISVTAGGGPGSFIWAAGLLVHEMERIGSPVGDGYLFRPANRQRNGFEMCALSSGAMNRRIQRHMQQAGLHEGETLHSFRRSAVQHAAELEHFDVARLMERGRWKSRAAFRLYVEEIADQFARGSL